MNVLEAFEVALPELPAKAVKQDLPKLDARVIAREQLEAGVPVVIVHMPGSEGFVRVPPAQWRLLQLFDGKRSFAEVRNTFHHETGVLFSEDEIRDYVTFLREKTELFYKTPTEKNLALKHSLLEQRKKRTRKALDPAEISIYEWDPDAYLTKVYSYLKFIYTRWFTLVTLGLFAIMAYLWADKFGEIWRDSFQFYNFTAKSATDLVEFWFFFGATACVHETAHGLTCKHFGGGVKKMGFILMYLAPAFFCDVTQVLIYGSRWQRIATFIAGIWGDLLFCFVATVLWWGTPSGMLVHDLAYKAMMVTGIGVSLINLNPLIPLDGYYIFSELTGEVDLKEKTTSYVSSWVRNRIFGLPVEVEYVPKRRRRFYIIYSFLSAVYSYGLLIAVLIFTYHVFHAYMPEWAVLPEALLAYLMFKGRLRTLARFMKTVYLDKKERVRAWFHEPRHLFAVAVVTVLVLFTPVWRDFVDGRFTLEPGNRAIVRAEVPGLVEQVFADEGQPLAPGAPIAKLQNLSLETAAARTSADLRVASARATQSQLRYSGFGSAQREKQQLSQRFATLSEQMSRLQITSPITGVIVTPRVHDLTGTFVEAGTEIAEVNDTSVMTARVYIPEFAMRDVGVHSPVLLRPSYSLHSIPGNIETLKPASFEGEADWSEKTALRGIVPPRYYVGTVVLANDGALRAGMSGSAKIYVQRRSLAGFTWRFFRDVVQRRLW